MKLRELVDDILIDPRKLTDYALDSDNPKGRNKALMFARYLGYTKDNYQLLLQQINQKVLDAEATPQNQDQHGTRYQIDLEIQGLQPEQVETVRTGWLIPNYSKQARLVTLYIKKKS
jgi:filamentous hemagglutinin